jgi:hypothetical protein
MEINEISKSAVILLRQIGGITARVFNEIRISDVVFQGVYVDTFDISIPDSFRFSPSKGNFNVEVRKDQEMVRNSIGHKHREDITSSGKNHEVQKLPMDASWKINTLFQVKGL